MGWGQLPLVPIVSSSNFTFSDIRSVAENQLFQKHLHPQNWQVQQSRVLSFWRASCQTLSVRPCTSLSLTDITLNLSWHLKFSWQKLKPESQISSLPLLYPLSLLRKELHIFQSALHKIFNHLYFISFCLLRLYRGLLVVA